METITKITSGASAVLLIVSLIMGAGLLGQENVYACLDSEIAMVCNKLSAANAEGIQTRCYYINENNKSTYKVCKTGWAKFKKSEPVKFNAYDIGDFVCDDGNFIKECRAKDGMVILRVKNE